MTLNLLLLQNRMFFWLKYFQTWFIIKRKQILNRYFSSQNHYLQFAIVCAPRSGSNWLHTLLNSHPNILSKGEILRRTYESKMLEEIAPIQDLIFHSQHTSIKAVGLKLFYQYLNNENYGKSFQEVIDNADISIIHLVREDSLAQYASLKRAEDTQRWSQSKSSDKAASIIIDHKDFINYQKEIQEKKSIIKDLFMKHQVLEVCYEQMVTRPHETLIGVQEFLNIKPRKLFSLLQKQSTGSLKNEIANWDNFKDEH